MNEFEFPVLMKSRLTGAIVEFVSETCGTEIRDGKRIKNNIKRNNDSDYEFDNFIPCTNEKWWVRV